MTKKNFHHIMSDYMGKINSQRHRNDMAMKSWEFSLYPEIYSKICNLG